MFMVFIKTRSNQITPNRTNRGSATIFILKPWLLHFYYNKMMVQNYGL